MPNNKDKIKAAVIGTGYLGSIHARIYSELNQAELIGVVDIDENKGIEVARKYNTRYYRNIEDIIESVDAVSITVPTSDHLRMSLPFIKKGKALLIEKPIAHDIEAGNRIIKEAEAHNSIIQIGHLERFNPAIAFISEKILDPLFVEFIRIGPFVGRGTDVDVIRELMIHDLDLINFFVKQKIISIDAIGAPVLSDKTDIVTAWIVFEKGCRANLTASRVSLEKERKIRIFQKNGCFSLDLINQTGRFLYSDKNGKKPEIILEELEITKGEPLKLEIESFLDCILNKKVPLVTAKDGLAALKLSDRLNERIFIPDN